MSRTTDMVSHNAPQLSSAQTLKRVLHYLRPHKRLALLAFFSALVAVVLSLAVPILIGLGIDTIVGPHQVGWDELGRTLRLLAACVAAVACAQWVQGYATNRLSYEAVRDLRDDAYSKLRVLPMGYIDSHAHGDLMSRIVNDADAVGDGLLQGIQQLFTGIITILGTLIAMVAISPVIALVVVVVSPVSVAAAAFIAKIGHSSFVAQQAIQGQLGGYIEEHVSNQRLIDAFAHQEVSQSGFDAINRQLYQVGEHAQFASSLSNPGTRFANNIVYAVVAVIGCWACATGFPTALTIGAVQSFLSYTSQYTKPFNEISGVMTQVQTAFASARRLFELLDAPAEKPDPADAQVLPIETQGAVAFDDVWFSYTPEVPLIQGISWQAKPGDRIALVGTTGCGKTTLINLLLRFYDIQAGAIEVDGYDTSKLTRASLRSAFGMVLQDTWLFEGAIHDNIAYGKPDATRQEVEEAARQARADAFIRQLPQGYDTIVRQGTGGLSQGQRQLLCIARVMLADPSILLLDEATSSIDTRTEVLVQEAFDAMIAGRTSLIVAHRLSTIRNATCILVMDQGKIVERGTHEELLARGGAYAKLYQSQFEGA
ncbi:sugar ABC transporter ATP-binding protein [Atopobiaceae bacterium P1]|uniref:Fatty acid ABC transporter ATP-binding/permease protein n=1 Tax=Leptogranulimonas caecicola TaxID=2894156 RepID=A0AAU9CFN3_9ACTN|nr:ABC transporter ATP-binding protein [Leptogranulimonas caecicola]BCV18515.1 sugar ABC transporter ATP-binding protein [Atopobiaceae bacterium P1]BDC90846.1 sugar ABC transporter ATP-binding protein [Leptogranulimonas caecicola]